MDFWNSKHLQVPAMTTYKARNGNLDLEKFKSAIQKSIRFFSDERFLTQETALLHKIVSRMKLQFRQSKDFKTLEKLKHALSIYIETSIVTYLVDFSRMIPKYYSVNTYIPTKNMLSYILIRLQGFVKLMERIYKTCLVAAKQLHARLAIGHFWKILIIMLGVVSRIFTLTKYCARSICVIYGKLLPYLGRLENPGRGWLPPGYIFPGDLRDWLNVDWIYEDDFIDLTVEPKQSAFDYFNFIDDDGDDDIQFSNEYILIKDDETDLEIIDDFKKLPKLKNVINKKKNKGNEITLSDSSDASSEKEDTDVEIISENSISRNKKLAKLNKKRKSRNIFTNQEDIGEEIDEYPISQKNTISKTVKKKRRRTDNDVISISDSSRSPKRLKQKRCRLSKMDSPISIDDDDDQSVEILEKKSTVVKKSKKKLKRKKINT